MNSRRPIYLDNHATTRVDPRVLEVMWPWFAEHVGNAASIGHAFGTAAREAVDAARQYVAALIGATPEEVVFTSGATEANNLAIKGGAGGHVVTSAAEHRAVLDPVRRLRWQRRQVTILGVDRYGRVDPQAVADAITPHTSLVSIMLANNEVGTFNPIAEIGAVCREFGVTMHTDAAQAVGRTPVDVRSLPIDLMSFTAHKLYGPQGVGALYVRKTDPPIRLTPQIEGGGHERRLRSGTLPVALCVGFGEACRLAMLERETESVRIAAQRDGLQHLLVEALGGRVSSEADGPARITVNGHPTDRLPGNLNVSFAGVDGEALLTSLDGLAVSSGSACTSADPEPSHVLRAMGVDDARARASLRFGLGRFTTDEEIDRAAHIVVAAVTRLAAT